MYLPPNEWLQRVNFTGGKQYQLEARMPSEEKKNKGKEFAFHEQEEVSRASLMFHLPLTSAPDQFSLPALGTKGAAGH